MKYQVILNDVLKFETDNISEYIEYLQKNEWLLNSILYDLLEKSNGYTAKMATQ